MDEHVHTSGIWELKGTFWILPILVEIQADAAFVKIPDMPLLARQRDVLKNALSQLAIGGTADEPIVPLTFLLGDAEKSRFTDPESVVVWNWKPPSVDNLPKEEGVDEFLKDWLLNSGLEISKASAAAIYVSLVTHMMHWLVNRRKPVNLIFGTLDPFQYRKNWKEILLGKAWIRLKIGSGETGECFLNKNLPTVSDMAQSEMLSFQNYVCNWTLEFTPSTWFHEHSNQVEQARRKRMGSRKYLASVMRTIMSHCERAQATYRKYLNEIAAKIIEVPEFNSDDSGYFTTLKKNSNRKVHRPVKAFVLPPDLAAAMAKGEPEDAGVPNGEVQDV